MTRSARVRVCLATGVVSACVLFMPYLLSALASSMLALDIGFRGTGGLWAVIVVQAVEIVLFAGSTGVGMLAVHYVLAALKVPVITTEALGASVGAALGVASAMLANGNLAVRATIPAVQFAGRSHGVYWLAGPMLGVLGAGVGIAIVAVVRGVKGR